MRNRASDQEINPPELGHDRQEQGMEEEASPMEDELCIEKQEALQLEVPQEVKPLTDSHTQIQAIVKEDLRLGVGDFGIWSRLDDETYNGRHLIIYRPEEGMEEEASPMEEELWIEQQEALQLEVP